MPTETAQDDGDALIAAYLRLIRSFNANDLGAIAAAFHADVSYTIPGRSPIAGCAQGVAEHLAQLKRAREHSGGTLHFEPHTLAAKAELLFVYGRITAERAGKRLDSDHLVVFRFREGLIVEGRTVPLDLYAFDEFWT